MSDSNIGGEASILEERRRKLEELREANIAYVNNFIPSKKAKDLHDSYGHHSKEELEEKKRIEAMTPEELKDFQEKLI